jgi:hypothetical protein
MKLNKNSIHAKIYKFFINEVLPTRCYLYISSLFLLLLTAPISIPSLFIIKLLKIKICYQQFLFNFSIYGGSIFFINSLFTIINSIFSMHILYATFIITFLFTIYFILNNKRTYNFIIDIQNRYIELLKKSKKIVWL